MAQREPAAGLLAGRSSRDRDRGELPEVGGHERQHARREEAQQARREGDGDRLRPGFRGGVHAARSDRDVRGRRPVPVPNGLRVIGGVVLVVLGLNFAGFITIPALAQSWRPLDAGGAGCRGEHDRHDVVRVRRDRDGRWRPNVRRPARRPARLEPRRLARGASGWGRSSLSAGRPASGSSSAAILGLASQSTTVAQGGVLLVAYTLGLGIPFLLIAVLLDRAPAILLQLVRHGRAVSIIGGLLVVAIGLAMIFDWLRLLPAWFDFAGV